MYASFSYAGSRGSRAYPRSYKHKAGNNQGHHPIADPWNLKPNLQ